MNGVNDVPKRSFTAVVTAPKSLVTVENSPTTRRLRYGSKRRLEARIRMERIPQIDMRLTHHLRQQGALRLPDERNCRDPPHGSGDQPCQRVQMMRHRNRTRLAR